MPWLPIAVAASAVGAWHVACALGLRRKVDVATACTLVFCAQMMAFLPATDFDLFEVVDFGATAVE